MTSADPLGPPGGVGTTRYDAFISYCHASDGTLTKSVQDGLRRLAKPWYGRRALLVFRDATGLSVNPDLWSAICQALDSSRFFVLMASPASAASEWVGRELRRWLEAKPAERVLVVLTDGEIEWVESLGDFDWSRSSALHPVLRGAFRHEPLYLDLRWARGDSELSLRNPRFAAAVADLAAPIHGRPREDLESEELRERRKLRRAARGAVSALVLLLVLSVLSTLVAFQQRGQARRAATVAQARLSSAESLDQLQTGRSGLALLLAVAGDRLASSASSRAAVLRSLEAEPGLYRDLAMSSGRVGAAAFSSDGTLLAVDDGGALRVWEVGSGRELVHTTPLSKEGATGPIKFGDGDRLVTAYTYGAGATNAFEVVDAKTGERLQSIPVEGSYWDASAGTSRLALLNARGDAEVWDPRTGRMVQRLPAHVEFGKGSLSVDVALSSDGTTYALSQVRQAVTNAKQFLASVDVWNVQTMQPSGRHCEGAVGGPFDGKYRMYPDAPQVVDTVFDANGGSVTALISGGTRGVIFRCDVASGDASASTVTVPTDPIAPVSAFSPDGSLLATRDTTTGTVRVFDAATGSEIRPAVREPTLSPNELSDVIFSPDHRLVATPGSAIGELKLWHTAEDDDLLLRPLPTPSGLRLRGVGPGGTALVVKTPGGDWWVVDRASGRPLVQVPGSEVAQPPCAAVFNDPVQFVGSGRFVASRRQDGQCQGPSVALWDLRSGTRRDVAIPRDACAGALQSVDLSGDGTILVVGCAAASTAATSHAPPDTVARLDISGPTARTLSVDRTEVRAHTLTVSPDGRAVMVAEEDRAGGGFQMMTLSESHLEGGPVDHANGNFVGPAAASADGRTFATGFSDGRLELWRTSATGPRQVQLAPTGAAGVTSLAFNPDGSLLAVGDARGGVQLWDVPSATYLGTVTLGRSAGSLGFGADGKTLFGVSPASSAPNGFTGSIVSISVDLQAWIDAACAIVQRNLAPAEWKQFLPGSSYRTTCPATAK